MEILTPQKKATEKWRKKNPKWYLGSIYVDMLNKALRNQNPNSKIWLRSGMPAKRWIAGFHDWSTINNGGRIEPIVGWRHFNMEKPSQVRKFLAPTNFKLVNAELDK